MTEQNTLPSNSNEPIDPQRAAMLEEHAAERAESQAHHEAVAELHDTTVLAAHKRDTVTHRSINLYT